MSLISGVLILYSLLFRLLRGISIIATHVLVVAGSLTDFENYNSMPPVHFVWGCWLGKSSWLQHILFNSVPKQLFFQMLKFPMHFNRPDYKSSIWASTAIYCETFWWVYYICLFCIFYSGSHWRRPPYENSVTNVFKDLNVEPWYLTEVVNLTVV